MVGIFFVLKYFLCTLIILPTFISLLVKRGVFLVPDLMVLLLVLKLLVRIPMLLCMLLLTPWLLMMLVLMRLRWWLRRLRRLRLRRRPHAHSCHFSAVERQARCEIISVFFAGERN